MVLIVPAFLNGSAEAYLNGFLIPSCQPYLAAGKPEVGKLGLPAVNKLLFENTAFVHNRVAHADIALRGKAVKIAGGKTAETAVSETGVRFAVIKLFDADTEVL